MQLVCEDTVSLSVNCLIVNRYHKKRSVFVKGKEGNEEDAEDDDDDIDNADNHVWEWPAVIAVRRVLLWVAQTGGQTCHRRFTILLLLFAKCLQCSQRHVNKRFLCSGRASPFNPKCRRTINATTALVSLRIQVWVLQSWYDTERVVVTCETLLSTHLCNRFALAPPSHSKQLKRKNCKYPLISRHKVEVWPSAFITRQQPARAHDLFNVIKGATAPL